LLVNGCDYWRIDNVTKLQRLFKMLLMFNSYYCSDVEGGLKTVAIVVFWW
jgi:hypothetical protein